MSCREASWAESGAHVSTSSGPEPSTPGPPGARPGAAAATPTRCGSAARGATHLGLRHRERRAGATAADRKEAGQEPAARLQDRRDRVHVLPAPARIDRAIARVLPQPVERVDLV